MLRLEEKKWPARCFRAVLVRRPTAGKRGDGRLDDDRIEEMERTEGEFLRGVVLERAERRLRLRAGEERREGRPLFRGRDEESE